MTCFDLSILCVTKGEPNVWHLLERMAGNALDLGAQFVLVADGPIAFSGIKALNIKWNPDFDYLMCQSPESKGYIESILDYCIDSFPTREYIFRLDDDESMPDELIQWLINGEYRSHPHWKFNRAHLWRDEKTVITNPPLWADHQTRLSTRALSYGRTSIHCGSPFGGGELAPYPIVHHKFLVKSLSQRREIVNRYNSIYPSAGESFKVFSVPEDVIPESEIQTSSLEFIIGHSLLIWAGY